MPPKRKASSSQLNESPAKRLTRSTSRSELTEPPGRITRSSGTRIVVPSPIRTPTVTKTYSKSASARRLAQQAESLKENEKLGQARDEVSDDELDILSPTKTFPKRLDKQPQLDSSMGDLTLTMRTRSGKQPETPVRRLTKPGKAAPRPCSETPHSEREIVLPEPTGSKKPTELASQMRRRASPVKPQATTPGRTSPWKRPLATTNDGNVDYTSVQGNKTRASSPSIQGSISHTRAPRKQTKYGVEDSSPSASKKWSTPGNSSPTLSKVAIERSPSPPASRFTPPPASLVFHRVVLPPVSTSTKSRPRPKATERTSDSFSDEPPTTQPLVSTHAIDLHSSSLLESEPSGLTQISTPPPLTPKRKLISLSPSIHIPRVLPNHLHACLVAQKRAILQAIQRPPEVVNIHNDDDENEDSSSTNKVAAEQLTGLLSGTINRGEGNSCLILGPRGSGKSRLLAQCISSFYEHNPLVIRLSGWTQHSDRLAMREIAHQLSQQTGTSFLPQGTDESEDVEADNERSGNLPVSESLASAKITSATHLPALISLLPTLSRPTIVILDGFDLFTLHPRQALLYCLLDTAQSCRAGAGTKGLAVIGVTSRIDTIVHLEKRVKSRFSGRMIRTAPPRTLQVWQLITKAILTSKTDELWADHILEDDAAADWRGIWTTVVEQFLNDSATQNVWNETFSITRDVRMLTRILLSVVLRLSPSSFALSAVQLTSAAAVQRVRPHFSLLHALPYPAICLLIASVHADTVGQPVFTFEMLHESFRDQVRASTSAPVQVRGGSIGMVRCSRQVLMSAFEDLVAMRAFVPAVAYAQSVAKEFVKYRSVIEREDVKRAVEKMSQVNLRKWLTKATQ
ncbi:hypothetical protein C0995_014494 [Termitomyces sp. Mi166|nr:hypothetical protein C0995_014494 [Termitomyces sp. Mi166\